MISWSLNLQGRQLLESERFTARELASGLVLVAVDGREQRAVADVGVRGGEAWVPFSQ